LFAGIYASEDHLETLKIVFNGCQYLKSINIWCGGGEKETLEAIIKYSQNISTLTLYHLYSERLMLLPEELESFFISWANRVPQKPLSLIIIDSEDSDESLDNYIEIIKKYIKLGIIEKFKVTNFGAEFVNTQPGQKHWSTYL